MTVYVDHHLLAAQKCVDASLELLECLPETDTIHKMRELLEYQFDIVACLLQQRHFGSDGLDSIIQICHNVTNQIDNVGD
jgi:hypothetical protein